MSNRGNIWIAKVDVAINGSERYEVRHNLKGLFCKKHVIKMYHIPARTSGQAREKAKKYGTPISISKPHIDEMIGRISVPLDEPLPVNLIDRDERPWKVQRNNRIENREKDKENLDIE